MDHFQEKFENRRKKITANIEELSRLLGMIPSDNSIQLYAPLAQNKMALSDWLSAARESFFKLSLLISKELDIQLQ